MNKKKFALLLIASSALLVLASCNTNESFTSLNSLSTKETRNFEALTSMNLLSESISSLKVKNLNFNRISDNDVNISDQTKAFIENDVLPSAEVLINNGINIDSTITTLDDDALLTINEVSYKYIEKISYNLVNEINTYTFIYNEGINKTITNANNKISGDIYHRCGLAYKGDLDIATINASTLFTNFRASSSGIIGEDEKEDREVFVIGDSKSNYIKVAKKIENENNKTESKFDYRVVKDGVTTLQYSLKIENENNLVCVKIIKDDTTYRIRQSTENNTEYFVRMNNEHTTYVFTHNSDGTYSYVRTRNKGRSQ